VCVCVRVCVCACVRVCVCECVHATKQEHHAEVRKCKPSLINADKTRHMRNHKYPEEQEFKAEKQQNKDKARYGGTLLVYREPGFTSVPLLSAWTHAKALSNSRPHLRPKELAISSELSLSIAAIWKSVLYCVCPSI